MDTVVNLVDRIKKRASIPAQEERFGDPYFVELMKEEMETSVLPFINALHEEFFVMKDIITFETLTNFEENYIPIPRRSFARGVRQISWGRNGTTLYPSSRLGTFLSPEEQRESITPGFIFENDALRLVGSTSRLYNSNSYRLNDAIELSYYHKVPTLVLDTLIQSPIVNIEYVAIQTFPFSVSDAAFLLTFPFELVNGQQINVNDSSTLASALVSANGPYYVVNAVNTPGQAVISLSKTPGGAPISITDVTALAEFSTLPGVKFYSLLGANINFPSVGRHILDIYKKSTGAYLKFDCVCSITPFSGGTVYDSVAFTTDISREQCRTISNNQKNGFNSIYPKELILLPADINCYAPLPAEVDNLLTSCVADRLLEALGDIDGRASNAQIINRTQNSLTLSFGKRMVGATKKVVPTRNLQRWGGGRSNAII